MLATITNYSSVSQFFKASSCWICFSFLAVLSWINELDSRVRTGSKVPEEWFPLIVSLWDQFSTIRIIWSTSVRELVNPMTPSLTQRLSSIHTFFLILTETITSSFLNKCDEWMRGPLCTRFYFFLQCNCLQCNFSLLYIQAKERLIKISHLP